ncbi:hypothetical protein HNQ59_002466 [Chitinivorax tropicus]|uniref:DUF938 domain-containing protein n=1 Tax=Chitinivorax tropicus TaxID=714531 RepID=A0A840MKI6_9PROT|nr:DUF938 domain-containing protein [Chitinivorax tropicus]MBB5019168.1 hypothetical protein [Chitinivorax tropicus]
MAAEPKTGSKPYSDACERNQGPILEVLQRFLIQQSAVLEIGSGTGQHAIHMARHLPWLTWQTSDLFDRHAGIHCWIAESGLHNVKPPLLLDVTQPWPALDIDHMYTANTFHIMPWSAVCATLAGMGRLLSAGGYGFIYGPFNYQGRFTAASNAEFDAWLKAERGAHCGIRDAEAVIEQASVAGLSLVEDNAMPANNHMLVFKRLSP